MTYLPGMTKIFSPPILYTMRMNMVNVNPQQKRLQQQKRKRIQHKTKKWTKHPQDFQR